MLDLNELKILAKKAEASSLAYFNKNKKRISQMDAQIHELHAAAEASTDCLQCANCCKTLGPAIYDRDIERMAKQLRMKPSDFFSQYLRKDEDGDYVFQQMPCPFLMPDNYCMIYEARPKACREYPHTDRKKFYQIYKLSVKNTYTCPIVYEVIEEIKKI